MPQDLCTCPSLDYSSSRILQALPPCLFRVSTHCHLIRKSFLRKGKGRENVPATMYQHSSYEGGSDSENPGSNSWLCRLGLGSLGEDGHPSILICSIFTYSMFLTTVLTHQDVLGAKCKTLPSVWHLRSGHKLQLFRLLYHVTSLRCWNCLFPEAPSRLLPNLVFSEMRSWVCWEEFH